MDEPTWAKVHYPADRLPGDQLLLGAQGRRSGRSRWTRSTPSSSRPTRSSASRCRSRRSGRRRGRLPCSTASRWRPPSRSKLAELGDHLLLDLRGGPRASRAGRKYLGSVVPHGDNFFAALNSAVFSDGSFVYMPKGVRCPMELSTYFRINAAEHRPVRAHADHRRRGQLRQLSRRLHGADARREPAARRGGRAGRAGRRRDQVLDRAELVSRRQGRQGRHLQLRDQARRLPRPRTRKISLDPGRDRLGDHLEVPERASCRATTRSASSTRWR